MLKARRAELAELKAESGVLARTLDILNARSEQVAQSVAQQERDRGVSGYKETQDELERVGKQKNTRKTWSHRRSSKGCGREG